MEGSISEDDNEDSREDYLYFEKEVSHVNLDNLNQL